MSKKKVTALIFLMLITVSAIYNVIDNNRIKVKTIEIPIDKLPEEFDGFKILQITDLHSKTFGKNQKWLLKKINSLQYDMIAITGDMENIEDADSAPFFNLLDGIKNKNLMFYINGNAGPFAFNEQTGINTDKGEIIKEKGCILLKEPYEIKLNGASVWITNQLTDLNTEVILTSDDFFKSNNRSQYSDYVEYTKRLKDYYDKMKKDNKVKILLSHNPQGMLCFNPGLIKKYEDLDYDLVIAGHYHGGQFRLPLIGALYIPYPTSKDMGFFPRQEDVMGLSKYSDTYRYISAGLGASKTIPFLDFRLFNTPEINLITLRKK